MSEKFIRYLVYIIKGGVFILPFLALIVGGNFFSKIFLPGVGDLFFPFITGKNFFFRIVVEILFLLWVFAAVFDKNYRPKRSPLLFAVTLTFFILVLATIFGESPYRSFWSNYERMEGLVGHIHLFLYFLILGSVFKTKKDWQRLFAVMLGVSFIAVVYGFLQYFGKAEIHQGSTRLDATFGNATYLAIFLVFHLFLTAIFMVWFRNLYARIGLGVLMFLELAILFFTATRGAILGFLGGIFIFALLTVIFSKNKKIRYSLASLLLLLIVLVALFIRFKDLPFIKHNLVLERFASISTVEATTESRFTIWNMSWQGFQEHPFLGWGPENYNLVFNKYYQSELYKQEPWFDHAHNIVFDWLVSAGILGFLAYAGIFGAALYLLWRGYRKGQFSLFESAALTSLFAAYCFHNIFVFDNLTSYFMFFSVLAYIHVAGRNIEAEKTASAGRRIQQEEIGFSGYLAVTAVFLAVIFSMYFINLKPLLANTKLIETLNLAQQGQPADAVIKNFDEIFAYGTFGNGEAREQLGSYANNLSVTENVPQKEREKVLAKAIEEMEKQAEASKYKDARYLVFLAGLYSRASRYEEALITIDRAIELSPKKQQMYFVKADVFILSNQIAKAADILKTAYDLDPLYSDAVKNLAMIYIYGGQREKGDKILIERFGTTTVSDKRLVNAYASIGDFAKVRDIWLRIMKSEPNNAQYHVNLAATYLKLNEREKAIAELQRTAELNPEFKQQAEYFINEIKAGRNP